ncbi:MAG: hypothetical protein KUG81_02265 [Gammaproteobacteria bacterium]|nr:hypothetical protein [Gammaproteobacteria bacterium]
MIDNPQSSLLLAGLPESGKTTFLGALSHVITSGETTTSLQEAGLPDEREYMRRLANKWVSCEEMGRTLTSETDKVELHLKDDTGPINLVVPDLAGESWETFWSERRCSHELFDYAKQANGLLFFIHSNKVIKPCPISEINALEQMDIQLKNENPNGQQTEHGEIWEPEKHSPTQATITDILQTLAHFSLSKKKLAIMISAWDLVVGNITPQSFLEKEMPLLSQYLNAGFDYPNWEVFGVSAQGGDLKKDGEKLSNLDLPSSRIILQNGTDQHEDITRPLQWVLR